MKKVVRIMCIGILVAIFGLLIDSINVVYSYASFPKTSNEVKTRISELEDMFRSKDSGKNHFFTQSGSSCKNNACDQCNKNLVFESKSFQERYGFPNTLKKNQLPKIGGYTTAWSCCGFSSFVGWYVFRTDNDDIVKCKTIKSWIDYNIDAIKGNCQIGDSICFHHSYKDEEGKTKTDGTHYAVIISFDDDGLTVLDANYTRDKNEKNVIKTHKIGYKNTGISGFLNKVTIERFYSEKALAPYNFNCNHSNKNSFGCCDYCGARLEEYTIDKSCAGKYTVIANNAYKKYTPYAESGYPVSSAAFHPAKAVSGTVNVVGSLINKWGNLWYQLDDGWFIYSERVRWEPPINSKTKINLKQTSSSILFGDDFSITGSVSSNVKLKEITATLDGKLYATQLVSGKSITIDKNSPFNTKLKLKASDSPHVIKIMAEDEKGTFAIKEISVSVAARPICKAPKISYNLTWGGIVVTIKQNEPESLLVYTQTRYGLFSSYSEIKTSADTVTVPLWLGLTKVTAYATKKGYEDSPIVQRGLLKNNGSAISNSVQAFGPGVRLMKTLSESVLLDSETVELSVEVSQLPNPDIDERKTKSGTEITIENEIQGVISYYSLDGITYQRYNEPFTLTSGGSVYAYSEGLGYEKSETVQYSVEVTPPESPRILKPADSMRMAQGDLATFTWNEAEDVDHYRVSVLLNGTEFKTEDISNASYFLKLEEAGSYALEVAAVNDIGESEKAVSSTVESVAPSVVTFRNSDDKIIKEEVVSYGKAATAPQPTPEKRGWHFVGWDKNFSVITEDTVVTACFERERYTVKFVDREGNPLYTEQVLFEDPASTELARQKLSVDAGYEFVGWSISAESADSECDLGSVDSNMTAVAVIRWQYEERPMWILDLSADRNDDTDGIYYSVNVSVRNWPNKTTAALLRVSLKTATGKMVKTESRTIRQRAGQDASYSFLLNYSGNASKVEAVILGFDRENENLTGASYSSALSADIQMLSGYAYGDWSDWSNEKPAAVTDRIIESRTLYKYSDLQETTSTSSSLSGWSTPYMATTAYSEWGSWSDWTTTRLTGYNTDIQREESKTQYRYYRCYCNKNRNHDWYGGASCFSCSGYYSVDDRTEYLWSDIPYSEAATWANATGNGLVKRKMINGVYWYYYPSLAQGGKRSTMTRTVYRYSSRTATTTYYYKRWSGWSSEWQTAPVVASSTRQIQTLTQYRYKDKNVEVHQSVSGLKEDLSGQSFDRFTGTLADADSGVNLSGKLATVMVYKGKNSDPNESQLQYIGQITLGEGNTYDFDLSYKTMGIPSIQTGDFVVSLGVEGSTGFVNIGIIEAPKPVYEVKIYGIDKDNPLSVQAVTEGHDAVIPAAPEVQGYQFIGWNGTGTNVHNDMSIYAYYVPITYAVVFVDWVNGQAYPFPMRYGSSIRAVADMLPIAEKEGYTSLGWDLPESDLVTDNQVISAKFVRSTYHVTFFDDEGNVLSESSALHGDVAELPEAPEVPGKIFITWESEAVGESEWKDQSTWWKVKSDLHVYPVYIYEESAMAPRYQASLLYEEDKVMVELTAEEGATIYYTLDGSDPDESSEVYTKAVELPDENSVVRAIAVCPEKNFSEIVTVWYDYALYDESEADEDFEEIGRYAVLTKPGESIDVQVNIENNPGIVGYLFKIRCDRSFFYLNCDSEGEYICTQGEAAAGGSILCYADGDEGYKVFWFTDGSSAAEDGNLFSVSLQVAEPEEDETLEEQISTIVVYCSPINIVTEEDVSADLEDIYIDFSNDSDILVGDINGDGNISAIDVIRVARSIIGELTLSDAQKKVADVTGDGKVTNADVIRLARYLIGAANLGKVSEVTASPQEESL